MEDTQTCEVSDTHLQTAEFYVVVVGGGMRSCRLGAVFTK
jgi:hypothetical protein